LQQHAGALAKAQQENAQQEAALQQQQQRELAALAARAAADRQALLQQAQGDVEATAARCGQLQEQLQQLQLQFDGRPPREEDLARISELEGAVGGGAPQAHPPLARHWLHAARAAS
jgi:hypothetical protein